MSVYQVEEFYIYISGFEISEDQKQEIEELLSNGGYSRYEFQDDDTTLSVDDIFSEDEGESLEEKIMQIIEG